MKNLIKQWEYSSPETKTMFNELRFFKGKDKIIFLFSAICNIHRILIDRTILTTKFLTPLSVESDLGGKVKVNYFYEIPFYAYNYDFILSNIKKDSVLIDVGAHFGEVSYRFLKEKKGFAYLFEPNPNNQKVIKKMFSKEKMKNFKLFPFALGSSNTSEELFVGNPLSYEGSIKNKKGKKIRVETKKLDTINLNIPKDYKNIFFKIDVEGYEVEALLGMINFVKTLKKSKNVKFLIEIKTKENLKRSESILRGISPKLYTKKITNEDYLLII